MASNPASPIRGPRNEPSLPGLQEERDQVAWFPTSLESPTCSVRLLGDPLAEVDDGTRLSDVAAALMTPSKQETRKEGLSNFKQRDFARIDSCCSEANRRYLWQQILVICCPRLKKARPF